MSIVCKKIECCLATDIALGDLSGFSLVGGDFPGGNIAGNPESTFIVECPEGIVCEPGVYPYPVTIPKDTIIYPYGPPPPDGGPVYLRLPCGDSVITRTLQGPVSDEQIAATLAEMLAQCGQAAANLTRPVNTAGVATLYSSSEINPIQCEGKLFSAAPGGLLVLNADKTAKLPAGTHTDYISQETVDAEAEAYVVTQIAKFKDAGGQCGYWNTEQQKCPPDGDVAAANTFFSAVSQAQADQDALDSLPECACNSTVEALTWGGYGGGGTVTGSGQNLVFNVTNSGGSLTSSAFDSNPAGFNCTLTGSFTVTDPATGTRLQLANSVGGTIYDSGIIGAGTYNVSQAIFVASSASQTFFMTVTAGGSPSRSIVGTLTIGPV
jgi:hypothetical protein